MKNRSILYGLCVLGFTLFSFNITAQVTHRDLLSKFSLAQVRQALIPQNKWKPFPVTPEEWRKQLPDSLINLIIIRGEDALKKPFNSIPATVTLEFVRNGNRIDYEHLSFVKRNQLWDLVLAETVERKGRFLDHIADGIWSISEETFWGINAHIVAQKAGAGLPDAQDPIVELFSAETAAVFAWTDYFVGADLEKVSKLLRPRIYYEVNRRIFVPMATEKFGWAGNGDPEAKLNNWAPWIMSNYITANLLIEKDEARRAENLERAMKIIDQYINGLGVDGGCDEGPSYWFAAGGATFDGLKLLDNATAGKVNIFSEPFIKKVAAYIYKTHIAGNYFINVADAHPKITADGIMIYRFGQAIHDPQMEDFGNWAFHNLEHATPGVEQFQRTRTLYNLFEAKSLANLPDHFTDVPDAWFSDVQLMASRTNNGLFVSAHGGNNGESHNHNDVGDFSLYADGYPVIIDVGSGTYTARTFSNKRYDLWFNTSPYHNLPTVNGQAQGTGLKFEATLVKYHTDKIKTKLSMEISKSYPADAGLTSWIRDIQVDKTGQVSVIDNYQSTSLKSLTQSFMTVCNVDIDQSGKIYFNLPNKQKVTLEYDSTIWDIKKEPMELVTPEDQGLKSSWDHQQIWRILLTAKTLPANKTIKYLIHK